MGGFSCPRCLLCLCLATHTTNINSWLASMSTEYLRRTPLYVTRPYRSRANPRDNKPPPPAGSSYARVMEDGDVMLLSGGLRPVWASILVACLLQRVIRLTYLVPRSSWSWHGQRCHGSGLSVQRSSKFPPDANACHFGLPRV
ncbi:hypothetical protein B0T16DRAFT_150975 [Cercophora newfieldiana]|uniref:Secreted protein n=1 Tax=Cercophora newfieldiana TaxID=92897 RepID=A0AA39Y6Z1_9PEZI|nr:hypothetical protein B0T16DRAFT_150975 [Cercophora newfieldiana]